MFGYKPVAVQHVAFSAFRLISFYEISFGWYVKDIFHTKSILKKEDFLSFHHMALMVTDKVLEKKFFFFSIFF